MKSIWCFTLLAMVFLATGICAAEVPDLLGIWTGSWSSYDEGIGYSNSTENVSIIFTFIEQDDRLFAGNITIKQENEPEISEGFAGAIGLDNKTLYIAEFDKGYSLGTIISNDEMELIYFADGENASVAIDRLHRTRA
ncbi:MAG: hypothetical protein NTX42_00290 [Methanothrix sp.]|nr:hypothetical protein [Methanothrix sp.]